MKISIKAFFLQIILHNIYFDILIFIVKRILVEIKMSFIKILHKFVLYLSNILILYVKIILLLLMKKGRKNDI